MMHTPQPVPAKVIKWLAFVPALLWAGLLILPASGAGSGTSVEILGGLKVELGVMGPDSKRCLGFGATLTSYPAFLNGKTTLTVGRGKGPETVSGYRFKVAAPCAIYLFVHQRGDAELAEIWENTGLTAQWKMEKGGFRDSIFRMAITGGEVAISPHPGKEGNLTAMPHLVVVVPAAEDQAVNREPAVEIKHRWQAGSSPNPSAAWADFQKAPVKDQNLLLPDFSYAGYDLGRSSPVTKGKIFSVRDYGARPDDLVDDGEGIEAAIQAASEAGGGVVFLPKGRYLVNTSMAKRKPIFIRSSHVVIQGEGCGDGGTVIHQIHPFETGVGPADPAHYHLGDTVFYAQSVAEEAPLSKRPSLAEVRGLLPGGAGITLDRNPDLKPGSRVFLMTEDLRVLKSMIAPHEPDPQWGNFTKLPMVGEIHRVKSSAGNQLIFEEPLRHPVGADRGWVLKSHDPLVEVGFEDIAFLGNAYARMVHHRNDLEDSGWAFIKMKGVANGWVRRCAFIHASQTVSVNLSSSVSLLNLFYLGNPGHHIARIGYYSHGVLGGLMEDRAHYVHGPSVSQKTAATVYWRLKIGENETLDSHSGRPFATLYDRIDGGSIYGSTGGLRDFPQHLGKLVIWNLRHGRKDPGPLGTVYDFWKEGGSDIFYNPIIVGLHGEKAHFAEAHLEYLESLGTPVGPESLYEAQLALRLGGAPAWVAEARGEFERLSKGPFPPYFNRLDPASRPFLFPESFAVKDLLTFMTSKAMRVWGTEFYTFDMADPSLSWRGDQCTLRHALYTAMSAVFELSRNNNRIFAGPGENPGTWVLEIISGPLREAPPQDFETREDLRDFKTYSAVLGGKTSTVFQGNTLKLRLELPLGTQR